ncbi:hypothetical protein GCM10028805_42430 [Spirosoma harenae]
MKQSLVNRLTNQPGALPHLLANLTEAQIRQRPQSDKWSIFENLAHLGRYQEVFMERQQRIRTEDTPFFDRYIADNDPDFPSWTQLPFSVVVDQFHKTRTTLNKFLGELPAEELNRIGLHPAFGPMTVEGWTEFFLLHEAHHFFTILKLGGPLRPKQLPMGL